MSVPPIASMMASFMVYDQLKRSFYVFVFQTPLAEMVLDEEFVRRLWADWSPGLKSEEDVAHVMDCLATPERRSAAIGYYRAALDPSHNRPAYAAEQEAVRRVGERPVLYLHGVQDGCMGVSAIGDPLPHLPPGSKVEIVEDAGHFLQLDRPTEVNRLILDWLA
jgi:pimeloyl-ACP methyl ester carboxylesterase